jgi:hypothetical protein
LFVPLVILILIVVAYNGWFPSKPEIAQQNQQNPVSTNIPVPPTQAHVCQQYEEAARSFKILEEQWNSINDPNGLAATHKRDSLREDIKQLYSNRNRAILKTVAASNNNPSIINWIAKITKVYSNTLGIGHDVSDRNEYASIYGEFQCSVPIAFSAEDVEVTNTNSDKLSSIKIGDPYAITGTLISHDVQANAPETALQWGGILVTEFGLWGDSAFNSPALRVHLTMTPLRVEQ